MNYNNIQKPGGTQTKTARQLKYLVILDYHSAYPDPLVLKAGEILKVEEKKCEYGEWLWCTNEDGQSGWVPETHLKRQGDNGELLYDYDATELTVNAGEEVLAGERACDWLLCTNSEGKKGWVPEKCLERL